MSQLLKFGPGNLSICNFEGFINPTRLISVNSQKLPMKQICIGIIQYEKRFVAQM